MHLQSEHPDLPTSNPEELLARLFMDGDGGKGLYFVDRRFSDTSETDSDSESDDMDWELANNDGKTKPLGCVRNINGAREVIHLHNIE